MAKHSVNVIVKARDEASKKFLRIGGAAQVMGKMLTSAAISIKTAFVTAMKKAIQVAKWMAISFAALSAASVKWAMDAEESENLFEVTMGKMADATRKWSKQLSESLYLNEYKVRRTVSVLNAMFKSMGMSAENAAAMSQRLTQLSYDMASFYNLKPAEAFQKLQAGIAGETEPLKRLGILLNETTVKTWALNNGIVTQGQKLSELQKVYVRYRVLMEQTKEAQGDMQRTLDSSTNVFRSLRSILKQTAIDYGRILLPAVTKAGKALRDWAAENRENIIWWAKVTYEYVSFAKDVFLEFVDFMRGDWQAGMKFVFDSLIQLLQATFKTAITMAITAGKGIWKGIREGLLGGKESDIEAEILKLHKEKYGYAYDALLGGPRSRESVRQTAHYQELRAKAEERIAAKRTESIIGGSMKTIVKHWTEAAEKIGKAAPQELAKSVAESFKGLQERLKKLGKAPGRQPIGAGEAGAPSPFSMAGEALKSLTGKTRRGLAVQEARFLTFKPGTRGEPFEQRTANNTQKMVVMIKSWGPKLDALLKAIKEGRWGKGRGNQLEIVPVSFG